MMETIDAWGAAFLAWTIRVAIGMFLLALFLTFVRLVLGPNIADRVMSLDLLAILGVGFIGLFALQSETFAYLDVAIALALVGFLATVAFSRFMLERGPAEETRHD